MSDDKREDVAPLTQKTRLLRLVGVVLFTCLAVWMLCPVLTSVHLEAFSAELQSMAIQLNAHGKHGLTLTEQAYPITTEFLYMSRSGLVDALQCLMRLTGSTGDGVFRLLMLISMAVFVVSSLSVARRFSNEPLALPFAVFLLTPGLLEIGFFFSDNLPSAALAILALAIVPRKESATAIWIAIGALWAAAILVRFDAVFIAPALGICLLLEKPRPTLFALRTGGFAIGIAVTLFLAQALTPFRIGDSLQITRLFGGLHELVLTPERAEEVRIGFFGVITPILVAVGIFRNCRTHNWRWIVGLVVLPVIFYLYVLPKTLEIRMFLLLGAPALLIHGATGLKVIWEQRSSKVVWRQVIAPAVAALIIYVLLGPVTLSMRDGPRTAYGRIWATFVWLEWQRNVADGMSDLDQVVSSIQPGETILAISSHYNADGYFRLRLLEDGYKTLPSEQADKLYPGASEVLQKGDRTVLHLRCQAPYLILSHLFRQSEPYAQALQIKLGLDATPPQSYGRAVLLNWGQTPGMFWPVLDPKDTPPWMTTYPQYRLVPIKARTFDGKIEVQPLSKGQVEGLRQSATNEVNHAQRVAHTWKPIKSRSELRNIFAWRFGPAP